MNHTSKEKRTKEDILRLLDRAIEQEEKQAVKIQQLENDLETCRKKAENPRAELQEAAFPASKTAFRIDYYRTAENSPIKGLIEHLPSRNTLSFTGEGFEEISAFVSRVLSTKQSAAQGKKKGIKATIASPIDPSEQSPSALKKAVTPLLRRLLPDLFPVIAETQANVTELPPAAERMKTKQFSILEAGQKEHRGSVYRNEPFQLEIPLGELPDFWQKPCVLRLKVESLDKFTSFNISENCHLHSAMQMVPAKPIRLTETGAYRITAMLTMAADARSAYYRESRLLLVV